MFALKGISQTAIRSSTVVSNTWSFYSHSVRFFAVMPDFMEISMPALSPTMSNGSIAQWLVKEGDAVKPGDVLASIQTDKSTLDFVTQDEGYVAKILKPAGDDLIDIGVPIAVMVDNKEDISKYVAESGSSAAPAAPAAPAAVEPAVASTAPSTPATTVASSDSSRPFISPFAKVEAEKKGIDIHTLKGTGPNGRIIAADVADTAVPTKSTVTPVAAKSASTIPVVALDDERGFEDIKLSPMRKVIAKRLTESKQSIPHYYLSIDCLMDPLLQLRSRLNKELENRGKLSINDFVLKAAALSLRDMPAVNASWMNDYIRQYKYVDVSVAVAIPEGLITPVVPDADKRGLLSISNEVRTLSKQAKENTLTPEQYNGGTFTVSNLGMFGIKNFTAIINPPQSCILAVGGLEKRVVPNPQDSKLYNISSFMNFTLSCDHRIVDGALGAKWLQLY
ncbi:hypothetical protein WA158_005206 [Blastocystis sp. Blastoise]